MFKPASEKALSEAISSRQELTFPLQKATGYK